MTVSVPAAANSGSDLRRSHGRLIGVVALLGTAAALGTIPALAGEGVSRGGSQALFIAQIALLLLVGRLMGEVAQGIGQPSVMGQLIGADIAPDQAILREASRGYDLVVLGVSRRPGDMLFFGNTAAAVLERSPTSIPFVAS